MVGLGSIAYSPFPMLVTWFGWAYESETDGGYSWLPWALAFDTFPIIAGIFGINAGRLILRRSRAAATNSFIAVAVAIVSIIPGYIFWQSSNADVSLFLVGVIVPAILIGTVYTGIGEFARRRSRAAATASFIVVAIAIVSIIPGYIFSHQLFG